MNPQSLPSSGSLPRPLQLTITPTSFPSPPPSARTSLDGPVCASPVSASPAFRPKPNRRQSSISYISSPSDHGSRTPRHMLTRSMSLSASRTDSPVRSPPAEATDRPPLTLAEKHADLLSQMAAKESLCMELRHQLSHHESELLHLKQKWERIINRGFARSSENTPPPPSSFVPPPNAPNQDTLLEGIKGGFQDVGRMIAAGISEITPVVAPLPPTPAATPPQIRRTHLARRSTASTSTASDSTSSSTRVSESSASSLGDAAEEEEQLIAVEKVEEPSPLPSMFAKKMTPPASPTVAIRPKHGKRLSLATDFPSVPGMGMASLINVPPMSSWLSSVGSKWDELQRGPTYTKGQERATGILNDITQSIAMAFPPQPSLSVSTSSSSDSLPLSTAPQPSNTPPPPQHSILDSQDDDEDPDTWLDKSIMQPDRLGRKPLNGRPSPSMETATSTGTIGDDDWNW